MIQLLLMAAILPALKIDSDAKLSRYFMPYQINWIVNDAQMRMAEKSVRIGWTFGDAFKNVRKRLHFKNRDYLFSTKDEVTAIEFVQTCYKFCEIYNFTRSVLAHGVESMKVPIFDDTGKATKFTEEVKVGLIKFDNGSRIIAFSSNPNAMRAFGGDVGLDEFAFHPSAEALWASAQGRITWGFDLGVWSSHNGDDTLFYQFATEAQAGKGGWSYYRVTIEDAVECGLVEKINAVSGSKFTREQFIEDCKTRARLPEVFDQDYMCQPRGGSAAIVPWASIMRCAMDYSIERLHLEDKRVKDLFGEKQPGEQPQREAAIRSLVEQAFQKTFSTPARYRLGYDVAASGMGDLACIYVDALIGNELQNRALMTMRTEDWHFQQVALFTFLRRLTALKACGDETGLGRNICWNAAKEFPGVFTGVNFRSDKADMGTTLMNQLSSVEKRFPKGERDIPSDYFAMRKTYSGSKWIFTEGRNAFNPASHCDIAWAGALSSHANNSQVQMGGAVG